MGDGSGEIHAALFLSRDPVIVFPEVSLTVLELQHCLPQLLSPLQADAMLIIINCFQQIPQRKTFSG
jgi:hypothetical protein